VSTQPAFINIVEQFRAFIVDMCGTDPGHIRTDGQWGRFRISDTRHKGSKPGRYKLHLDSPANGLFIDMRQGKRHRWLPNGVYEAADRAELRRKAQERRVADQERYAKAAQEAAEFWASCSRINGHSHPYLDRKGIAPHGTRYGSGKRFGLGDSECVIVPLSDSEGNAVSLQAIREDGERRFWPGSTHAGTHLLIGKDDGARPVVLCEGFATACSIHDATGHLVVMCVTSANMVPVSRWAAHKWPGRQFYVAGDDDWHLPLRDPPQPNAGREAAETAARNLGAPVVMPNMHGLATDGGDDFNDMLLEFGGEEVRVLFKVSDSHLNAADADDAKGVDSIDTLPLEWFDDIKPSLEANWLVDDIVPAGGLCLIYGHPGSGKSFFALDLTMHIAAGRQWRGRDTRPGLVIYVGAEGQRGLRQRIAAFRQHYGASNLPFALIPVEVNMLDADGDVEKLSKTIELASKRYDLPVAMIVLDTLSRTFGGGDEVGPDMVTYINNGGRLQQRFNCAQLDIHHRPKDSANETPRGHGSLWGACDTIILVEDRNGQKTAKNTKQKDAEPFEPIDFSLKVIELGHDEKGREVTSCVVVEPDQPREEVSMSGFRLTDEQKIALRTLHQTIDQTGGFMAHTVPDDRLPKGPPVKVARLSDWVVRTTQVLASPDKQPDSVRRAIQRHQNKFQAINIIGIYEDWVWITRDIRTGPDK
jgi:phage/plasmid primase-like uncharacterized protein